MSWIKMRTDLRNHPKVVRMASALQADRLRIVGGLWAVWCMFDAHSVDGTLEGYTFQAIDEDLHWPGFSEAMANVKWLLQVVDGLELPDFDTHNGTSAKRRAQDANAKKTRRNADKSPQDVGEMSASDADTLRAREREREDIKETPLPPSEVDESEAKGKGRGKASVVSLPVWIEAIRAKGEKSIPQGDPVLEYADEIGLPVEFLHLAWKEFRHRYSQPDAKKYRDWRAVFRKAIRGNWLRLWRMDGEQFVLTTEGMQAKLAHGREAA